MSVVMRDGRFRLSGGNAYAASLKTVKRGGCTNNKKLFENKKY